MVPGYTLETIDAADIDHLFPFFFAITGKNSAGAGTVTRNGKTYKKVKAGQAKWMNDIF
jgi:hypothetical protein